VTRVLPVALFALFSLNYGFYKVAGDARLYFAFVQNMFGDTPMAVPAAYNFGVGLLSAPFYALGRLAQASGVAGAYGSALPVAAMTIASIAFTVIAWVLSSTLLRRMRLPHPEFCAALAVLGSPVWYYASFEPMHSHPPDAALFALIALLAFELWREPTPWRAVAVGGAMALALTVRPFNVGALMGLCAVLIAHSRVHDAVLVTAATVAGAAVLLIVPWATGARFGGVSVVSELGLYPLSPLRMLFTNHRGLFVWTPLTLLAVAGIAAAIVRHDADSFIAALSAMAAGVLVLYAGFKVWDGGWSFSARFLSSLVPFYAVGVSLLLRANHGIRQTAVMAVAVLATVWSMFLGMNHAFGFADQPDGAAQIVRPYLSGDRPLSAFVQRAWAYSRVRHVVDRR
jgi:hypothetical protein